MHLSRPLPTQETPAASAGAGTQVELVPTATPERSADLNSSQLRDDVESRLANEPYPAGPHLGNAYRRPQSLLEFGDDILI